MSGKVKEATVAISGMTCAACAIRIEKGLQKLEGVESASVNLALEKSTVVYDAEKMSFQDIQKKSRIWGTE